MKDFLRKLWDNDAAMVAIVIVVGMLLSWYVGTQL